MVHFVGAGPGATDLITERGKKLLEEADVVIYAGSLVNPALLSYCREGIPVYDSARLSLEEVFEIMKDSEEKGLTTVRLHTGDPSLYGAIREQIELLEKEGIDHDITPGVSSFNAAAAALSAEYTPAGVSQSVIITRMEGRTKVPEGERLRELSSHGASMVIFLSMGLIKEVSEELLKGGAYSKDTKAAIVYKVTWKEERVLRCTVSTLYETARDNNITKTALIIVGDFLSGAFEKSRLYAPEFSTEYRKGKRSGGIAIFSFTDKGERLAIKLKDKLNAERGALSEFERDFEEDYTGNEESFAEVLRCGRELSLSGAVKESFFEKRALVFIGALGIAVRAIAPYIQSKAYDPAVIVIDEKAENVIPVLSGHLGGANQLSKRIEKILEEYGTRAVITTATDINSRFAVDLWAKEYGLKVINPECIKIVSSAVLKKEPVVFKSIYPLSYDKNEGGLKLKEQRLHGKEPEFYYYILDEEGLITTVKEKSPLHERAALVRIDFRNDKEEREDCLRLCPVTGFLGSGCKKGITADSYEKAFSGFIEKSGIYPECIRGISSIELKKEEEGLLKFSEGLGLKPSFYSADELERLEGSFTASEFVKEVTGVDSVSERSAVMALKQADKEAERVKDDASLLYIKRYKGEGVTFALAMS